MKKILNKVIEFVKEHPYSRWLLLFLAGPLWFYIIEWLHLESRDIKCFLDDIIPFSEIFIVPYMLWFPFIAATNAFLLFNDKWDFLRGVALQESGFFAGLIIFTVYPTKFTRPEVLPHSNFFTYIVKFIYWVDEPVNALPSLHVYMAVACTISLIFARNTRVPLIVKLLSPVLSVLIILSTMYIKQHSALDAIAAFVMLIVFVPVILVLFRNKGKHPSVTPSVRRRDSSPVR